MSDADGTMSTYVLACQVSQRLSSKGVNGYNRSALLTQLAGQLQQFHQIQLSWDEQWHAAKDTVDKAHSELQHHDAEMRHLKAETNDIVQAHQDDLAKICRDFCGKIDEALEGRDERYCSGTPRRLG